MYQIFANTLHACFYTLALICGIVICAYAPAFYAAPTVFVALYIAIFGIYALHTYQQDNHLTARVIMSLGIMVMGSAAYHYQQTEHVAFYAELNQHPFDIIGTVTNIMPIYSGHTKQRITINAHSMRATSSSEEPTQWQPINKNFHVHTAHKMDVMVGDAIEISSLTCKPQKKDSFSTYLIKEKVAASVFVQAPTWALINRPTYSLRRYIHILSANLNATLQKKLPRSTYALFSSLFLGDTNTSKKQLEHTRDQFRAWGIMHYLARSGLHLVIFVAVWQTLLSVLPLPFLLKELIMLLLSLIYFALSCSSISFLRALYTFVLYKACSFYKRPSHLIYLLSLVCFCVLLYNPMQLFFLDFQLSFTLTFALALFNQVATQKTTAQSNR